MKQLSTNRNIFLGALTTVVIGALLARRYFQQPAKQRITSDQEGHYDIDGVSLGAFEVVVASDVGKTHLDI